METRQIITPAAPPEPRKIQNSNALRVPTAHWAETFKTFDAAATIAAGLVCELVVPKFHFRRRVYCDVRGKNGATADQQLRGSIDFFLAGNRTLTIPFETAATSGDRPLWVRLSAGLDAYGFAGGADLIQWGPSGQSAPIILAPFRTRIACDRIQLVARGGSAADEQETVAFLGCYSEGEIDA